MTAQEAKALADSKAPTIEDALESIQESANAGFYTVSLNRPSEEVVTALKDLGYMVESPTYEIIQISWVDA